MSKVKFVALRGLEENYDSDVQFETMEEAVEKATQLSHQHREPCFIWQKVKVVRPETPQIVVEDIK